MFIMYQTLFNGQSMYCKVIIVSFDCVLFSFDLFSIVDVSLKILKSDWAEKLQPSFLV